MDSKLRESHRSEAYRKNGENRGNVGESSRSGWSASGVRQRRTGRRLGAPPLGSPPAGSSAGAALTSQTPHRLHEPHANRKGEEGEAAAPREDRSAGPHRKERKGGCGKSTGRVARLLPRGHVAFPGQPVAPRLRGRHAADAKSSNASISS